MKPVKQFYKNATRPDGLQSRCKPCQNEAGRKTWAKNPDKYRARLRAYRIRTREWQRVYQRRCKLKANFGLSEAGYVALLDAQNGVCAICHHGETKWDTRCGRVRYLAVDHDHVTGKVRGLLCAKCNTTLGNVSDNPELLRRSASYLEQRA